MIAIIATLMVLGLLVTISRWIASVPVIRTLSVAIDCWADSVQGQDAEEAR